MNRMSMAEWAHEVFGTDLQQAESKSKLLTPTQFRCTICHLHPVDADNGYDTCEDCLKRM